MVYEYQGAPRPKYKAPPGACDTHMHIYEKAYPMAPTALLAPPDGPLADYRKVQERLGLERTVIVQPTSYGTDNRCTLEAMAKIGENARGVVAVDTSIGDEELVALSEQGVRGIRFHMLPGGALPWEMLDEMAARTAAFGWHVQLQLDGCDLPDRLAQIKDLPGELVIDHVGKFLSPVSVDDTPFKALLQLVEAGAWVKLSAPYEISRSGPPHFDDVGALAKELVKAAPDHMLWATNWPHPAQDPRPDDAMLMDVLAHWMEDDALTAQILSTNPAALYGF